MNDMKSLTVSCYAIAFCSLGLAITLLMQQTQQSLNSPRDFSGQDFSAAARF